MIDSLDLPLPLVHTGFTFERKNLDELRKRTLFVVDEASGIDESVYALAEGWIGKKLVIFPQLLQCDTPVLVDKKEQQYVHTRTISDRVVRNCRSTILPHPTTIDPRGSHGAACLSR